MRIVLLLALMARSLVAAESNSWEGFKAIMWTSDNAYKNPAKLPQYFQRLEEMGVGAAMVYGDGDPKPLVENKFPYYVENMVNRGLCLKFNSSVTNWEGFISNWVATGRPESAFKRDYSLDDPQWQNYAKREVQNIVRKNMTNSPLLYDIRDELSITTSANPFDYDFSPQTLAGFRAWLKTQYADLNALNTQWDTKFTTWDEVKPFSTDEIKNRMAGGAPGTKPDWKAVQALQFDPEKAMEDPARWNFSPWVDFRTYMDTSLARTLNDLRAAGKAIDPRALIGIEGTQMPHAFGGFDLWKISQAIDWVEPYDVGGAREIFSSFMRGKPILSTIFENDTDRARRRLWHLMLEGDRGCIVWNSDECFDWKTPNLEPTLKRFALARPLREMNGPAAKIFMRAQKLHDPVYIHYSQASIYVDWLLESIPDGASWVRRFSSYEAEHNRMAKVRLAWLKAFQDLGYSPQFISSEQIERGDLQQIRRGVVVLPMSLAVSEKETAELRAFAKRGQIITSESTPGFFDQHGRLRHRDEFNRLSPNAKQLSIRNADAERYLVDRLSGDKEPPFLTSVKKHAQALDTTGFSVSHQGRARIHRFQLGKALLVAIERNINYQMSEDLKQAGGNEPLEKPIDIMGYFPRRSYVYDLKRGEYMGWPRGIAFTLDPWQPSLFAIFEEKDDSLLEEVRKN